ncbi:MAG: DUF362 domain-containing protein [bacterium]
MGKVSLVRTKGNLKQELQQALTLIGGLDTYVHPGDKVMLKPNLNGLEGYTRRELVASLIELLFDHKVKDIFLAEATFGSPHMTDMFFKKTGFLDLAKNYGLRMINLNRSEPVEIEVANPLALKKMKIAREALEADKIINLPNMKVHYATGITLALKNMKGILVGDEKRHFHEVGLEKAIVDLNNTIKPCLNIVDCIQCMERMGPRGGDMVDLELIMAGQDSGEVDYIGSRIMQYDLSEVRHVAWYIAVNNIDLSQIEVYGEKLEEVRYPFRKVVLEDVIPDNFSIHNRNACSSCMNAFLLSCQLLEEKPHEKVDIYMGELPDDKAPSGTFTIGFGNCCSGDILCHQRIKGCPPYPFALNEVLKKR